MAKKFYQVNVKIPVDLHMKVRELQIRRQAKGEKLTVSEIYIEVLKQGLE